MEKESTEKEKEGEEGILVHWGRPRRHRRRGVRDSHSVDQVSESWSSQAGHQSSGEAGKRTRRRMARAESRRSDEGMRWTSSRLMSIGVRWEVVPADMKRTPFVSLPLAVCDMKRSFECFTFREVLR